MVKRTLSSGGLMKKRDFIRVLSISDLHSGNVAGLTPDKYNPQSEDNYGYSDISVDDHS